MAIIELAGTICAGKKSLIDALMEMFRTQLPHLSVKAIVEDLAIQYELIHPYEYLQRQLMLMCHVTIQTLTAKNAGIPLTFVHRGWFDDWAFMNAFVEAGVITLKKARPSIDFWTDLGKQFVDLVILVDTPKEQALKRAQRKFGGAFKLKSPDIVFSEGFFDILVGCYQELKKQLPKGSIIVDGSSPISRVQKNAEMLFGEIIKLLPVEENEGNQNGAEGHTSNDKISVDSA